MTDTRLNQPYREAAGSTDDGGSTVLPVSIDGVSYLVDTSRNANAAESFRRTSIQLLNTQQNVDKGESALTAPEVWRRTYQSWHHGAGQKVADREDSDPYRFDRSKGINVWDRWQIGLLNDTTALDSRAYLSGMTVDGYSVGVVSGGFVVSDGTSLNAYTVVGMTGNVYATTGKQIIAVGTVSGGLKLRLYEIAADLTVTQRGSDIRLWSTTEVPTLLVFANFKLLLGTQTGKVYDITAFLGTSPPGTFPTTAVMSSPIPDFTWVAGCSGKKAIYLLGVRGDKTTIHGATIDDTDKTVDAGVVAELPDGEIGTAIYSYLGYVAIGTKKGFRFAAMVGEGGGLTYGPLIETPKPVRCFEGQGRFLYYGLSGYEGDSGIGRADLSEFVADLQPAYASDLMAVGEASSDVVFINTLADGRILFGTGGGCYKQADTYVQSGRIVMSSWTFNVVDLKTGLYVITQNSMNSEGTGYFDAYYDRATDPIPLGAVSSSSSPETRFPLVGVTFNSASLGVTIESGGQQTQTPVLYGLELRATYVRGIASEWQVPCILSDDIERDNGTVQARDVIEDFDHLLSLVETGKQFVYIEDGRQWGVYATDFIWSPQERSAYSGWQGVFTIYFREVR